MNGFDLSGVFKDKNGFYGKAGMHSSKMDGPSQVTVGSSTGTGLTTESKGTGLLLGVGYENNNIRYSFTHYGDVADETKLNNIFLKETLNDIPFKLKPKIIKDCITTDG